MKRSTKMTQNCIKMTITSFGIGLLFASNLNAAPLPETHSYCNQASHDHTALNERQVRRVVRNFLSSRGYTKQIAPGGAHIRSVEDEGNYYKTLVVLRESSAADMNKHFLYVDKMDHSISERVQIKDESVAIK